MPATVGVAAGAPIDPATASKTEDLREGEVSASAVQGKETNTKSTGAENSDVIDEKTVKAAEGTADDRTTEINGHASTSAEASTSSAPERDPESQEVKMVEQIEFYLSDSNLPYDRHMFIETQKTLSEDEQHARPGTGWVSIAHFFSFSRMRAYKTLFADREDRAACVAQSFRTYSAEALEVSEDNVNIRRRKSILEGNPTKPVERSIYIKGFPTDKQSKADLEALQIQLEKWVQAQLDGKGKVLAVRMRRKKEAGSGDVFKGSVFAECATVDTAKAFLALDPQPTFPEQSEPVVSMFKQAYMDMKNAEKNIDPTVDRTRPAPGTFSGKGFNAFVELRAAAKARKASPAKGNKAEALPERAIFLDGQRIAFDEQGKLVEADELTFRKHAVLRFTGLSDPRENRMLSRFKEAVAAKLADKESSERRGPIGFVELPQDSEEAGTINFTRSLTEDEIRSLVTDGIEVNENKIVFEQMTAEAERTHHINRATDRALEALHDPSKRADAPREYRDGRSSDRGRGGKSRGGGRGGSRGGKNDRGNRRDDRKRAAETDTTLGKSLLLLPSSSALTKRQRQRPEATICISQCAREGTFVPRAASVPEFMLQTYKSTLYNCSQHAC
ncbi:hypothetical protein E5Q_05286 [Mixia osmundae IAM 14324]|uniref:HTH La-type RNA-binding domain-containing protein n=1 Tax=Mixia osmundae (strain CBS 9802 / IAM 14324 / JCM 22182 / KY 12970) TaxID=764103 RepID=G7E6Y9_MIXOS|nr:hypothetical protein E5Q_05286 [Mixia osmundae IAM 14324]